MFKILVVDDNKDNVQLLSADLVDEGYEVVEAYNGREALEVAEALRPDVILMDINMPEMDGIEACRRLKENPELQGIPVIMVSARDQDEHVIEGLDVGAQDYITKPYTWNIVAARVRSAVRMKSAHDTIIVMNKKLADLYQAAHRSVDNISHEFRTPLTVIKEFASILRDGLSGEVNDEQRAHLDVIMDRVEDLAQMVNDMLDTSRLEAGLLGMRRRESTVSDILAGVRTSLERKARANEAELVIQIDNDLPNVYCDPEKIGRVIINLAINVIKFCPEKGRIDIWARRENAYLVRIGITDNGHGISRENAKKIFGRFKQVDGDSRAAAKGFGLGLNIARELVYLSLGEISVESEVGKGSTFSFTIPVSDPLAVARIYVEKIGAFCQDITSLSVVETEARGAPHGQDLDDADDFIRHLARYTDLVFRVSEMRWLLILAHGEDGPAATMDRIRDAWTEASRNRVSGPLANITLTSLGTHSLKVLADPFLDLVRQALEQQEAAHV